MDAIFNNFFSNEHYSFKIPAESGVFLYATIGLVFFTAFELVCYFFSHLTHPKYYHQLSTSDKVNYNSRVVSNFHAVVSAAWALYYYFTIPQFGVENSIAYATEIPTPLFGFSIGYFIVDLALVLYYYPKLGDLMMVAHHVFGLLAYVIVCVRNGAHKCCCAQRSVLGR